MDWYARRPDMKDIMFFMSLLNNATDVHVDLYCPHDGPLDQKWVSSAKVLRNHMSALIRMRPKSSSPLHENIQLSLKKVSIYLHGHIDGEPSVWYLLHKELRTGTAGKTLGYSKWVNTLPKKPTEVVTLVSKWPEEKIVPWRQRKLFAENAKTRPEDMRFEW